MIYQVAVRIARKRDVGLPVAWIAVGQLCDHVHYTRSLDGELRMPPSRDRDIAVGTAKSG